MNKVVLALLVTPMILFIGCKKSENATGPISTSSEWKLVRKAQATGYFWGLCFSDQNNGWAIGDSGRILHTSDGGDSWKAQESGTITSLKCVQFANAQKGWVGGKNDSIGITTNGGLSWTWQHPAGESRRTFLAMSFINEYQGWVMDNYSGILHTEDGGMTWTSQNSGTRWAITAVQFLDAKEGWATATNRVVLHTLDGGNSWATITLDTLNYGSKVTVIYTDIFFYGRSRGWISTNALASDTLYPVASVVSTSDEGKTWNCRPSPEKHSINSIRFVNQDLGWAASENGILRTTNAGEKWTYELEVPDGLFVDLWFVDQTHGWAITFDGDIYRYQAF